MLRKVSALLLLSCCPLAQAFDVTPSKDTSKNHNAGSGKSFNIFAGDPERVKRANEIRRDEFDLDISYKPQDIAVDTAPDSLLPTIQVGLVVVNKGKKARTFSFPDAQRIEVVIRTQDSREIYRWSANKKFIQSIGTSMVMPGERLYFPVDVPLEHWSEKPRPGIYSVEVQMANYAEFTCKKELPIKTTTEVIAKQTESVIGPTPGVSQ